MATVPEALRLYHITHVDNLPSILGAGGLWSDAQLIDRGGPASPIGMGTIKQRRLALPVKCYFGDTVGQYVPFYLCPRSIMLYLIYRANHPELTYRGGQEPILHLELDLRVVVAWADQQPRRWAFSLSNAGATYTEFRCRLDQLDQIDWNAVAATDFSDPVVKEGKQAEFLVHEFVPWHLVRRIGGISMPVLREAMRHLEGADYRPPVEQCRLWYF